MTAQAAERPTGRAADLGLTDLVSRLQLVTANRGPKLDLIDAVIAPPLLTLTIDGASTLEVTVADHRRQVLRDPFTAERSWAKAAGVNFELTRINKAGDTLSLVFVDAIAAALARRKKPLTIRGGTVTRRDVVARLAKEADVPFVVDPERRRNIARVVERSARGSETTTSWDVLGELASDINWRRFSDGRRLVVGSDDWLFSRDPKVSRFAEHEGGVHTIDFDLDVSKRASTATLQVDADLWALPPGSAVDLDGMGPADGKWLVAEFSRPLTSTRGSVKLVRKQHVLKEPKKQAAGEAGEPDFLPGRDGGTAAGAAANPARERMVQWALAQRGKPYIWGGNGPTGFDCSGLVQEATRAAGRVLTKPSRSQWDTCVAQGKTISVAQALQIRGALLFRMSGDPTHVAISLGNGSTMEAMGSAYGTNVFGGAASRTWTGGALWL